jgi:hypothetical protein
MILWLNLIGAGSTVLIVGRIAVRSPSRLLRSSASPILVLAVLYVVVFAMRIIDPAVMAREPWARIGTLAAIPAWPFVWTMPVLLMDRRVREELRGLQAGRESVQDDDP